LLLEEMCQRQTPDAVQLMQAAGMMPDAWQVEVLRSTAPRVLLNCCRQSGKTLTAAALALSTALAHHGALVLILSPSLRQSQESFRAVLQLYRTCAVPIPTQAESALRLELTNGARIISLPGAESTVRGYSRVKLLVVDEASRVEDDLYHAITPMMAVSGGRLMLLSTPYGQRGFFFEAWEHGEAWERVMVTAEACPRIPRAFLEGERASMPDYVFASEYMCRFVQNDFHVFRYEDLMDMLDATVQPWTFLQRGG
jgi:hypothetical protein